MKIEFLILIFVLILFRYFFIAGFSYLLLYKSGFKKNRFNKIQADFPNNSQITREILFSISTFIIYGGLVILSIYWTNKGLTMQYEKVSDYGLVYFFISILIMVIIHDTYFYWTHRLMHSQKIFKSVHWIHHQSTAPTPWTAFAFHPFEAFISIGFLPFILFFVPYHQMALSIFITFIFIYNIYIHLGFEIKILKINNFQYTTFDHDHHHLKGKTNYGLYFNLWDKWMGTYKEK